MNRICRILLFLGIAAVVHPPVASPQQLEIHCIDVGQGSSELVIGPNGTTILIDGGTSGKGRDEVIPYLDDLFAPATPALDYIIASHDDNDHYGGLNYIIDYSGYSIGTIYHCGDNAGFSEGVQIPLGTVIDLGDGARATCVGRYGQFIDGSTGSTSISNNLSICLLIEYGGFDYITAGDLETNENQLSTALIGYPPADPYLDPAYGVDVIHVNHHGSDGASCSDYVNRLKHEVALINGGTNYGHPRWTAVDRLKGRANYSDGSGATGVTWTGCTSVYRTTYDDPDDGRAPEWDCPTLGDMVVTYDGCAENYYVAGMPYPVDEWIVCTTPSPTPEGYHTPPPTPTPTTTPSPTPTLPPTPSATPTPEGYRTPTPTPSITPTPTSTPTPPASPTPPAAAFPFYDGFESGVFGESWSIVTDNEGRVLVSMEYQFAGTYSALLDADNGTYSTAGLILTIDLSTQTDVDLSFQWREFADENHAQDGVFISD
ncbi:MAG: MBL fold metallo-hydrolase, partial [PVC group bacterium]